MGALAPEFQRARDEAPGGQKDQCVCVCVRVCVLFHLLYVFLHRELNPGPNTESTKSWPVYYRRTAHVLSFDRCLNSKTTSLVLSIPGSCKGPYYHTHKP